MPFIGTKELVNKDITKQKTILLALMLMAMDANTKIRKQ